MAYCIQSGLKQLSLCLGYARTSELKHNFSPIVVQSVRKGQKLPFFLSLPSVSLFGRFYSDFLSQISLFSRNQPTFRSMCTAVCLTEAGLTTVSACNPKGVKIGRAKSLNV